MSQVDFPYHVDGRGLTATTAPDDHLRDLIEQVLFTAPGERVMRPEFGSGLLGLVFEPGGPELVAATQGGTDVRSYIDSMISGLQTLETLLRKSGVDAANIESVLDIGCGTGRLLMGWHCANPRRKIAGVDINAELIAWSEANLPGEWAVCDVLPPLTFENGSFDLVQLASVFTHLPLEHQKQWISEIRRLLKPGGVLVITLHGVIYKKVFNQQGQHSELPGGAIGSNAFGTFHAPEFAEKLFEGFEKKGYFERGHDADPPTLFPIAALQDVYVFRKV